MGRGDRRVGVGAGAGEAEGVDPVLHRPGLGRARPGTLVAVVVADKQDWVVADFNGIIDEGLLCLSHEDTCRMRAGGVVHLRAGMVLTVFDSDADEHGDPDDLFATGVVEPSPEYAQCRGSVWCLRIDEDGIRNESELRHEK